MDQHTFRKNSIPESVVDTDGSIIQSSRLTAHTYTQNLRGSLLWIFWQHWNGVTPPNA